MGSEKVGVVTHVPSFGRRLGRVTLLTVGLYAVVAGLCPAPSMAQPTGHLAAQASGPPSEWYGLPIVVTDALALAAVGATGLISRDEGLTISVSGVVAAAYLAGGPLVHWHRGDAASPWISLGIRVLPLAIGTPLVASNLDNRDMRPLAVGVWTILGGALAAMVVDSAFVAWRAPSASEAASVFAPPRPHSGCSLWTATCTW